MRRCLREKDEENSLIECTDSDKYTLDNLDLLHLPIEFTSNATSPRDYTSTKRKKQQRKILIGGGDDNNYRLTDRYQKDTRPAAGDCSPARVKSSLIKSNKSSTKSIINSNSDPGGTDDKSLVYIYTDQEQRNRIRDIKHYEDFLIPRIKKNKFSLNRARSPHFTPKSRKNSPEGKHRRQHVFPFKETPSGNLKVSAKQVAFQTDNISVLVADPRTTSVNIETVDNMPRDGDYSKDSAMDAIMNQGLGSSLGSLLVGRLADAPVRKEKESSEYEGKATHEILDPELNLNRLGYTAGDAIDWNEISLPEKKNLYLELYARITNFTNADCKVYIDNEEFNCHLIVLQCYSEVFHTYVAVKKVELPSDKCSAASFAFIYEWMITGDPSYRELNRENVLDIFNAAKYLKIRDLIEQCWAFIDNQEVFSEDTAFLLYVDAKEKNLPEVRELMLPRIQKFFLMLVSSQDWLELELEDVQNFLQSNYICVNCEMEIFMSAVRWLKHDWENRDQYKVQLLSCVRFGNIAPWQLVDIKRNPDNPDFKELAKDPDICKMIDDGLAFVIIKYWYGQENDDYQHWNSILALKEPPPRNWSGMDKTYFTYREFLIYLDQYRRNQMIEKSKPKERKRRPMHELKPTPKSSTEKLTPKMPTMDEFLSTRKSPLNVIFSPRTAMAPRTKHPVPFKKYMSKQRAATIIQAAFRGYSTRKRLRTVSLITPERRKRSSYERAYQLAKERSAKMDNYCKSESLERLSLKPSQKLMSMLMTNLGPERQKVYSYSQMNRISSSVIQPRSQYFENSSLFLAERESVMVFGGIDPHSGYGAGRNTGKDIFRYLPDSNVWEYIGEMPAPRNHHNVAFLTGRVYVVGGSDPREDELRGKSMVVDTVWSFDPIKRNWFSEGSLKARRKNFGLVVSKQCMFAIGGQDKHGRTIASVEKYNPMVGVWESQAPMNHPRMGVACTKHNDKIWAAGGMSGSRRKPLTDCVECYDIERNQWTEINRLRFPRCFSSLFSMSDRLYLIGGAGKIKIKDKTTSSVKEIDIWNEDTREWEYKTEMAIPRHGHCVAYLGTQILIIGGVTTVYMRALSNTECYCTNRGTWVRGIACLPTTLSGHATVTLPPAVLM